jgi:hypothetical protein
VIWPFLQIGVNLTSIEGLPRLNADMRVGAFVNEGEDCRSVLWNLRRDSVLSEFGKGIWNTHWE